jgi:hypothetical protein
MSAAEPVQSIFELTSPVKAGTTNTLSAIASSGLPVTFKVLVGRAKLSGDRLKVVAQGTVVVSANQPGSHLYLAASAVTRSIKVE